MTSAAPARKPYRKAPPQHRETRLPPPVPQPDINQVNAPPLNTPAHTSQQRVFGADCRQSHSDGSQYGCRTSPPLVSDSELDISSLSSLELYIPPPSPFSSPAPQSSWINKTTELGLVTSDRHCSKYYGDVKSSDSRQPCRGSASAGKGSLTRQRSCQNHWMKSSASTAQPKGILKQPVSPGRDHTPDNLRKSKSVELLDTLQTRLIDWAEHPAEQRASASPQSPALPSPSRNTWNWKMQVLEEKVRFSNFLDEITCRVLSPAHLSLLGMSPARPQDGHAPHNGRCITNQQGESADRTRRWDSWVASLQQPNSCYNLRQKHRTRLNKGAGPEYNQVTRRVKLEAQETKEPQRQRRPVSKLSLLSHKVRQRTKNCSLSLFFFLLCLLLVFLVHLMCFGCCTPELLPHLLFGLSFFVAADLWRPEADKKIKCSRANNKSIKIDY